MIFAKHPEYKYNKKHRLILKGGREFIGQYLKKYSDGESYQDYRTRRDITYNPGIAASALFEVRNAMMSRLTDIIREGSETYSNWVDTDVDGEGTPLITFIGEEILPELMAMGKVAIWVDSNKLESFDTKPKPYLYVYEQDDILNWDSEINPKVLLLEEDIPQYDENGLALKCEDGYRLAKLTSAGVEVTIFRKNGEVISQELLALKQLPVVIIEMRSLLEDIADHQVALLQLVSSDLNYCLRANVPFYTEQFDIGSDLFIKQVSQPTSSVTSDGTTVQLSNPPEKNLVPVGVTSGRRYPKGLERPGWIAPPTEPLMASMEKQDAIKKELRQLVNLALTNLSPTRSSSESKSEDQRGMEAGLSYIALLLCKAERKLAAIWQEYTGDRNDITISYPSEFVLKSDEERYSEADKLYSLLSKTPVVEAKRALLKEIIVKIFGTRIKLSIREAIFKAIDNLTVFETDPQILFKDLEAHLVSQETASQLRGYDKNEAAKAIQDHVEKLSRIAIAQSEAANIAPGAVSLLTEKEKKQNG